MIYMRKNKILSACLIVATIFSLMSSPAYAITYKYNQDVTGYGDYLDDGSGIDYPANYSVCGDYEIGYVAVHKSGGQPVLPYGTIIFIYTNTPNSYPRGEPITTPVGELTAFQVQDWGAGPGLSTYFFDVYCGRHTDYSWASSDEDLKDWIGYYIGQTKRDYYYY